MDLIPATAAHAQFAARAAVDPVPGLASINFVRAPVAFQSVVSAQTVDHVRKVPADQVVGLIVVVGGPVAGPFAPDGTHRCFLFVCDRARPAQRLGSFALIPSTEFGTSCAALRAS